MKKQILNSVLFLAGINMAFAQVGIGTSDPKTTLHVMGMNDNGAVAAADGVLVPRVNALTVNGTEDGQLVFLIADTATFSKGFHFWNADAATPANSAWVPIADAEAIAASAEIRRVAGNNLISSRAGVDSSGVAISAGDESVNGGRGEGNIAFGQSAGFGMTAGENNIFLGTETAANVEDPGNDNIYMGFFSGRNTESQFGGNIAMGLNSFRDVRKEDNDPVTGNSNIAIGASALQKARILSHNTAIGTAAGSNSEFGGANILIGREVARALNDTVFSNFDDNNVIIGREAARSATGSSNNVILGNAATKNGTMTSENIIMGFAALDNGTVASENVMIGRSNGTNLVSAGNQNTAVGSYQLRAASIGNANASFGPNVFNQASLGNNNIGIGNSAGQRLDAGTGNIVIGQTVANNQTILNNNIAIGNQIEFVDTGATAAASNQLNIQNAIFGTGNSGTGTNVAELGKIGIGQPAPQERLDVDGIAKSDNIRTNFDIFTSSATPITKENSVIVSDVDVSLPAPTTFAGITVSITNSNSTDGITFNTGNQTVNGTTTNTRIIPVASTFRFTSNGTEWFITGQL